MTFDNWRTRLEAFSWWDAPTNWFDTAFESAWFIKSEDAEGSFLVDTKYDTYEVFPSLSYSINDSWHEEEWWKEQGQSVPVESLGKWQHLYGLRGLHLPTQNTTAQEIWVFLRGGWSTSVDPPKKRSFWRRNLPIAHPKGEPEDFRQYLSQTLGLTEHDLWVFSCVLDSYNLGFALVPLEGQINTYEMTNLQVATAKPEIVIALHLPSSNLRNVGVGVTSFSFSVSGTGGSVSVDDVRYEDTVKAINKPLTRPEALMEAMELATRWATDSKWYSRSLREPLENLRSYLASQAAIEHFEMLREGGYAVAIIPLGGRTIWRA